MSGNVASINNGHHHDPKHTWMQQRWVRSVLLACVFALVSGFVAYTVIRLRVSFHNERQIAEQQQAIETLKQNLNLLTRMSEERMSLLEQTVYGDLDPKLREAIKATSRKPEIWTAERDKQLRARIASLENRLWQLEIK